MTSRRLAQLCAVGLFALTYWTIVSRPGVVGDEFVGMIYGVFFVLTLMLFGVAFLLLCLGAGGQTVFWSTGRTDQVRPAIGMELAIAAVMIAAAAGLHLAGGRSPLAAEITYLLAGTLIPAACLQFGILAWPSRRHRPSWLRLVLIGGPAIGIATMWAWGAYLMAPDKVALPVVPESVVSIAAVFVGATLEEVVFRVLLLTAILDRTGSRFHAVFLSSVAFGLMHVPGALTDPVLHSDWAGLQQIAFEYAPIFLMQTFIGLLLGVLWLRTGSITLIALTHAVLNLGHVFAYGLLAYG